jgi:hypothetical protein
MACSNQTAGDAAATQNKEIELSERTFDKLAAKRIYFGHMSVGSNIMAGVQDILSGYSDATLAVLETEMIPADGNGIFAHGPIGDNEYPLKKIENFTKKINDGIGGKADIAFFKFCYIDMMADQDAEKVFASYQKAMEKLKQQFPETTFVHVTVPLTVVQTGWKVPLKRLIGKTPGGYLDNINRNRYNQLLHAAYTGKEPLFDLAKVEATTPRGTQATYEWEGQTYSSLYPGYASDGRHLNEQGRRYVAQQLLLFLADI